MLNVNERKIQGSFCVKLNYIKDASCIFYRQERWPILEWSWNSQFHLGNLKMWSNISLLRVSFFAYVFLRLGLYMLNVNFENSTTCVSM